MRDTLKAYFSGHFDGEGCIRFRLKDKSRAFRTPHVQIQLAHLPTLKMYQKNFGGNIYTAKNKTGKPMFKWFLSNFNDILLFIDTIEPFSIEKKDQLLLAKEWLVKRSELKKTVKLPDSFIEYTNELHNKCTLLKK